MQNLFLEAGKNKWCLVWLVYANLPHLTEEKNQKEGRLWDVAVQKQNKLK
jgi:hypothetical protein